MEVSDNLPPGVELTGPPVVNVISGTATSTTCTGVAGDTSFTCDFGTVSNGAVIEIIGPARALTVRPAGHLHQHRLRSPPPPWMWNRETTPTPVWPRFRAPPFPGTVFRDFANDGGIDPTDTGIPESP